jgi:hypothetical protein
MSVDPTLTGGPVPGWIRVIDEDGDVCFINPANVARVIWQPGNPGIDQPKMTLYYADGKEQTFTGDLSVRLARLFGGDLDRPAG